MSREAVFLVNQKQNTKYEIIKVFVGDDGQKSVILRGKYINFPEKWDPPKFKEKGYTLVKEQVED